MFTQLFISSSLRPEEALWFMIFLIWILAWKGLALWYSARAGHKAWFVAILVLQLVGIIEIVYLLFFNKNNCCKSCVDDTYKKCFPAKTGADKTAEAKKDDSTENSFTLEVEKEKEEDKYV